MKYHPDKVHKRLEENKNSKYTEEDYANIYHIINEAWELLSNEYERSRYDFIYGFSDSSECKKTLNLQREKALLLIKNMEKTASLRAEEELQKGNEGLFIIEAYYGVIPQYILWNDNIKSQALGKLEDVKIQIQMLIENSCIEFINSINIIYIIVKDSNGEGATLTRIPGFYDLSEGDPKRLIIRYTYWGKKHQLNISDDESLRMPLKSHQVLENGKTIEMLKLSDNSKNKLKIIKDENVSLIPMYYII